MLICLDIEDAKVTLWNFCGVFFRLKRHHVVCLVGHTVAEKQIIWTHLSLLVEIVNFQTFASILFKTTPASLRHIRGPNAIEECAIETIAEIGAFLACFEKVLG